MDMKLLSQTLQLTALFGFSSASAEVYDKCPAFVSQWSVDQGAWNFFSTHDAVVRLLVFAIVYSAIAVGLFFLFRRSERIWVKFIPLVYAALIGTFLLLDLLPQDEPCSHYFLLKEMPKELFVIQIVFDFILFVIPLALFTVLWKKSKK